VEVIVPSTKSSRITSTFFECIIDLLSWKWSNYFCLIEILTWLTFFWPSGYVILYVVLIDNARLMATVSKTEEVIFIDIDTICCTRKDLLHAIWVWPSFLTNYYMHKKNPSCFWTTCILIYFNKYKTQDFKIFFFFIIKCWKYIWI
jgi:hypothetical protein